MNMINRDIQPSIKDLSVEFSVGGGNARPPTPPLASGGGHHPALSC